MEKIHFLGINGSGIAGVACLAKQYGYEVNGCDLNAVGNYTEQLKELNINILEGQSKEHIKNINKLIVSAAILYKDKYKEIEEVKEAIKNGIEIIKWQKFLDEYLAKNKDLICVCGTHGKTTTTTFVADMLEDLKQDPTVIIGGLNSRWNRSYRYGDGKCFVCESDEYGNNFLDYHPKYILINNIEMEHPEFFDSLQSYKDNFANFVRNIKNNGILIYNGDDENINSIIDRDFLNKKNVKIISYSTINKKTEYFLDINNFTLNGVEYKLNHIFGEHNIRNATMAIILMLELGFDLNDIINSVSKISLPKRRMEKLFDNKNIRLFDDYGHHHTQIYYNINTLKQNNLKQNRKIIAILEPHLISRFTQNYKEFIEYMELADYPIITAFYKSRENNLDVPNMNNYLNNTNIEYIESFDDVIKKVKGIIKKEEKVDIVVMGSGNSYKLSSDIVNFLNKNV